MICLGGCRCASRNRSPDPSPPAATHRHPRSCGRRQTPPPPPAPRRVQIRTDPRYTLSASGLPLALRQTVVAIRFSQIQGPDAPTPYEKSGLGRRRGCSSKGRLTDPKPAVGARLRIFPLTPRHPTFPAWSGASESGGFLPFPICLARDVHTLKTGIYYRPLRSPCPRADAARGGIQRDVPVKIWWHLVMLGSDRLKRADTVPDTTIRMRSENRDFRQLHCLETVSPRSRRAARSRLGRTSISGTPLDSHLR